MQNGSFFSISPKDAVKVVVEVAEEYRAIERAEAEAEAERLRVEAEAVLRRAQEQAKVSSARREINPAQERYKEWKTIQKAINPDFRTVLGINVTCATVHRNTQLLCVDMKIEPHVRTVAK